MTVSAENKNNNITAKRVSGWQLALRIVIIALAVIFLCSGVRIIQPTEVGIVLRFGKLPGETAKTHPPGLLIAFPYPIDEVIRVPIKAVQQIAIENYWQEETTGTTLTSFHPFEQGYCITGDYNVVLPRLIVKYQVKDAVAYSLAITDPEMMLRDAVSIELVRTVGELGVDYLLTEGKAELASTVMSRTQERLDLAGSGIQVVSVEINELIPPRSVLPNFQAVQSANIEKETAIRNAQTYYEEQIPGARADANNLINDASSYRTLLLARANSDANAFNEILAEYRRNPRVVKERLRNEYLTRALTKVGNRYIAPGPPVSGRLLIPPAYGP